MKSYLHGSILTNKDNSGKNVTHCTNKNMHISGKKDPKSFQHMFLREVITSSKGIN